MKERSPIMILFVHYRDDISLQVWNQELQGSSHERRQKTCLVCHHGLHNHTTTQPHTHTQFSVILGEITEPRTSGSEKCEVGLIYLDLVCTEQGGRSGSPEQLTEAIFVVLLKETALKRPQPVCVVHLHRTKDVVVKYSAPCEFLTSK